MTEADVIKQTLVQLGGLIANAVAEGATATTLGNETIDQLTLTRTRMVDSRVTALQAIGYLQEAEVSAQLLFSDTYTAEASDLIAQIRKSKELITNYTNHLANRIREAEKLINLMSHWVDQEMSGSGSHLRVAAETIQTLYNRY